MEESPDRTPDLRIGDAERHHVAEILRQAAGEGRITLAELDERLEAAYAARTNADLVPLTSDLPAAYSPSPVPAAPHQPARATRERHLCLLSGLERTGVWTVPEELRIVAFMGGADLDLRPGHLRRTGVHAGPRRLLRSGQARGSEGRRAHAADQGDDLPGRRECHRTADRLE